jgi:hypothetical protein
MALSIFITEIRFIANSWVHFIVNCRLTQAQLIFIRFLLPYLSAISFQPRLCVAYRLIILCWLYNCVLDVVFLKKTGKYCNWTFSLTPKTCTTNTYVSLNTLPSLWTGKNPLRIRRPRTSSRIVCACMCIPVLNEILFLVAWSVFRLWVGEISSSDEG